MRLMPNWLLLASFAGGIAFAATSCREIADPAVALGPQIRNVVGPLPHGITYSVGAPPTNDFPAAGGVPFAWTGASLLPGTAARVYASGDLTLTLNPDCYDNPTWAGITTPVPLTGEANSAGKVEVGLATTWIFQLNGMLPWAAGM